MRSIILVSLLSLLGSALAHDCCHQVEVKGNVEAGSFGGKCVIIGNYNGYPDYLPNDDSNELNDDGLELYMGHHGKWNIFTFLHYIESVQYGAKCPDQVLGWRKWNYRTRSYEPVDVTVKCIDPPPTECNKCGVENNGQKTRVVGGHKVEVRYIQ